GNMPIDLGCDDITGPNDHVNDAASASKPNNWQSYPILYSITSDDLDGTIHIEGTLPGPAGLFRIEFYANPALNASSLSEGQQFLGSLTTAAGAVFTADFPSSDFGADFIPATATDANGNTSEFSPCRDVLRGSVEYALSTTNPAKINASFLPRVKGLTLERV